jgi:hypothetical protein
VIQTQSTLKQKKYIGSNLGQLKNDYGDNSIIVEEIFIAPKIKYCKVLNKDGTIIEKFTAKGFNIKQLHRRHFIDILNGLKYTNL